MTSFSAFSFLRLRQLLLLAVVVPCLLSSCVTGKYARQRTMFQITKGADGVIDTSKLRRAVNRTARNYLIRPNDYLNIQVYTNKGERLIDPNADFTATGSGSGNTAGGGSARNAGRSGSGAGANEYLVQADGTVRLPLVDRVAVQGLSLVQADSVLQRRYNMYYKETYVKTSVSNNRVIILGSPGGQVIPLPNDNMNLLEVLALAGGLDGGGASATGGFARYGGQANNIRIIRGDLKNPQVQFIDLTTLEGMRRGNLQVEPNDIIYIQPIRRPLLEALTDITPVVGAITTAISLVSLIIFLQR